MLILLRRGAQRQSRKLRTPKHWIFLYSNADDWKFWGSESEVRGKPLLIFSVKSLIAINARKFIFSRLKRIVNTKFFWHFFLWCCVSFACLFCPHFQTLKKWTYILFCRYQQTRFSFLSDAVFKVSISWVHNSAESVSFGYIHNKFNSWWLLRNPLIWFLTPIMIGLETSNHLPLCVFFLYWSQINDHSSNEPKFKF